MRSDYFLMLVMTGLVVWTLLGFPGRGALVQNAFVGVAPTEPASHSSHAGDHGSGDHDHGAHSHGSLEIGDADQIPTIKLSVLKDPMSGWNANVEVEHFRFAPERASQDHAEGEGHAHLYVDGVKVNRLYSEWYHLGKLAGGNHTVRVSLSSNDHRDLTYNGNVIADTINVQVD